MFEQLKFMVIEDVERERFEVLNQLSDAGFDKQNRLALPATYEEAVEALANHAEELDVVFLDLNIPRDATDARPEKGHGRNLLNLIHKSYNPRAGLRVVVVSGEDLLDGFADQNMYDAWPGTLVSIAQKGALAKTMKASLKRLKRDPLAQHIRRVGATDLLELYEVIVDASQSLESRLKSARGLGLRMARNEVEHYLDRVGSTNRYADNLNGLIKDHIEDRFAPNDRGRKFIDIGAIQSDGGWDAFLWRGSMVQHLYALNNYRNAHEHLREQPYDHGGTNTWNIPRDVLESVREGHQVGVIIESIIRDLLQWYLPWHEQVYMPWREGQE